MSVLQAFVVCDVPELGPTRCAEPECGGAFVADDVAVVIDQGPGTYVRRTLYFHRRHFDALLGAAPTEEAVIDAELAAIRASMALTGLSPVEQILAGLA